MANPLHLAQSRALADNAALERLMTRYIGSGDHPQGYLLVSYRVARRAMATALAEQQSHRRLLAATEVLHKLQWDLDNALGESRGDPGALRRAVNRGAESCQAQVQAYSQADPSLSLWAGDLADVGILADGWSATVATEVNRLRTLVAANVEPAVILGDTGHMGEMGPGRLGRDAARLLGTALALGFTVYLWGRDDRLREKLPYQKQAIACGDHRTTETCLLVSGQIVPLNSKFTLRGSPRYADKMGWSPFHQWCRTSVALYLEPYDDGLTAQIRATSRRELARRKGSP